jgi:phosphatidylserine/phosphatidylglycerophosphate/cardiolipin synthase-like enzyme
LGVKIHKLKHVKLHAKLILADDSRAIIGSINLAPGSFDSRRELAIQVDDPHIIHRIRKTLENDWANSHPLDLSDAALLAELEDYDPTVREDLAISEGKHNKDEKHHNGKKHHDEKKHHDDKKRQADHKPLKGTSPPQGA